MKYVSLFAGIGGFDLALNRLGHEAVYANEWDKYSAQTYEKNFYSNKCQIYTEQTHAGYKSDNQRNNVQKPAFDLRVDTRDITTVPTTDIPDHDLLVGGFPCQSFSTAGKRRGFDDTRGTLFFDIARILKDKRPRYFILENVKGLLSHDSGKTFQTILGVLSDLGYEYQWQVLNSKNFGVPQNRERVFIVGHIRGEPRPKVFPIGNVDQVSGEESKSDKGRTQAEISHTLKGGNNKADNVFVKSDMRIRRLTPIECERLQGFPDGWTEGVSDTQRYKQLGNAVTVNVVEAVASRLIGI